MKPPKKWKFALMVWIAIYPAITLASFLLGDFIKDLALPVRTLIMTGILVPLMVYVLLPLLRKLFGDWIHT
jgi:antibiotic biosynthesis monooxygenase (ABM) superfamily enzyme